MDPNGISVKPEPAPPPAVFPNEFVSLPENRLNVILCGLMLIDSFKAWFLETLGFAEECTVYAPSHVRGVRPDLVVVHRDQVVGWVEVELQGENHGQLAVYRNLFREPVRSIVGRAGLGGDLSLQRIADELQSRLGALNEQQRRNVSVFVDGVRLASSSPNFNYRMPNDDVRTRPILIALEERLAAQMKFGTPPIPPGLVLISTVTDKGWTARVHSKVSGSVSLLWDQSMGGGRIRVPSFATLSRCLPVAGRGLSAYAAFWSELGVDVHSLNERQSHSIAEQVVIERVDHLAKHFRTLASAYGVH